MTIAINPVKKAIKKVFSGRKIKQIITKLIEIAKPPIRGFGVV
ncbi:MAG: hypothetical protein ABTQ25_07800 [Nitrosomonas ureae]